MKFFFTLLMSICATIVVAQTNLDFRTIETDFESGSQHSEQAGETLSAKNKLEKGSMVDYKAGKSIMLLPGFEAKAGTTFNAHIGKVIIVATASDEKAQLLNLTAYPNPFEGFTTIKYTLIKDSQVKLQVLDTRGKLIQNLVVDEEQKAGTYYVEFTNYSLNTGTYIYTLDVDGTLISKRLIRK